MTTSLSLSIICDHIVITLIEICFIIYISLPGHLGELVKWSEQITSLAHMRHGGLCVLTLTVRTQVRKTWWNTFYIRGDITLKCTAESNEIFSVPKAWLTEWHQWGIVSHWRDLLIDMSQKRDLLSDIRGIVSQKRDLLSDISGIVSQKRDLLSDMSQKRDLLSDCQWGGHTDIRTYRVTMRCKGLSCLCN